MPKLRRYRIIIEPTGGDRAWSWTVRENDPATSGHIDHSGFADTREAAKIKAEDFADNLSQGLSYDYTARPPATDDRNNRPNHFMHDSLGNPGTCTGDHNHPEEASTSG